ncbi:prepilin-type N-terminal cleavage/methylation domain-containing protein [Pseudomonas putida]
MNLGTAGRCEGYTLLELLLVVLLASIAVAVATGVSRHALETDKDRESGREMALVLREVRSAAIYEHSVRIFRLDLSTGSYKDGGGKLHEVPKGMKIVTASSDGESGAGAEIIFYPAGNSSGGNIVLSRGGKVWRIDVPWLTGVATLHQLGGE